MQTSASLPADQFNDLLSRLPADLDLDALARQTKAIERQRKIESGSDLLRLALARGNGLLSLSQTATWASMIGSAEKMSDPAIKFRLDKSEDFLAAVMARQLAATCTSGSCGSATAPASASMATGDFGACMGFSTLGAAAFRIWNWPTGGEAEALDRVVLDRHVEIAVVPHSLLGVALDPAWLARRAAPQRPAAEVPA